MEDHEQALVDGLVDVIGRHDYKRGDDRSYTFKKPGVIIYTQRVPPEGPYVTAVTVDGTRASLGDEAKRAIMKELEKRLQKDGHDAQEQKQAETNASLAEKLASR